MLHDRDTGRSSRQDVLDLAAVVRSLGRITAEGAACRLYSTEKPTASEREKARRALQKLARNGQLVQLSEGDRTTSTPAEWGPQ